MRDGSGERAARALRAGALTLTYDSAGVRWIRFGSHEVLRGIYVAVRDANWRTIPATIRDLTIDAREDTFRIELTATHRHLDVDPARERRGGDDDAAGYNVAGRDRSGNETVRDRFGTCRAR